MQFHIEKMTCGGCVKHVTQAVATVDPSAKVEADTVARKITVTTTASRDAMLPLPFIANSNGKV